MATTSNNQLGGGDGGYLGRTLDERYRLDEEIGAGAIGKVYAGTQLAVDRKVAIKLLHPAIRDRELSKERFLREAKAVARMSHSSCLTLFDFGSDDTLGCFYMVTEFVEGRTLADEMRDGVLPLEQVFHILYQVTTALQHAHERGILHRDLKPENIMLVANDSGVTSVKVLDFGLARIREEAAQPEDTGSGNPGMVEDSRLTNFGEINGTPAYMSPEQCRGDLNLTPACDYYSLGVLAYELIEGNLPYQSSVVQRLLAMHMHDPIPPLESGRAPDDIEGLLYRLLAKKPEHRLQSADEILEALRPYVSLDPSREFTRASLDRFKRDGAAEQSRQDLHETKAAPVAESGEQTLVNYQQADTPVPRDRTPIEALKTLDLESSDRASHDSAFGTMLAAPPQTPADEEPEEVASGRGTAVALVAAAALAVIFGAWWVGGTPEADPAEAAAQDTARALPERTPVEKTGVGEADEATEASKQAAHAVDEADAGEEASPEPPDETQTTVAAEEPSRTQKVERTPKPRPTGTTKEKKTRPRKLKLTY